MPPRTYPALALAVLALTACRRGTEDIPFGAIPQPVGSFQNTWQGAQAFKAEAADFVFYTYEWHEGTADLNPVGRQHLSEILPRLSTEPFNVVIQPQYQGGRAGDQTTAEDPSQSLDLQRRLTLIDALQDNEVVTPEERVLIASVAPGLYGDESVLIRQTYPFGGSAQNNASTARSSAGNVSRGSLNSR